MTDEIIGHLMKISSSQAALEEKVTNVHSDLKDFKEEYKDGKKRNIASREEMKKELDQKIDKRDIQRGVRYVAFSLIVLASMGVITIKDKFKVVVKMLTGWIGSL